MYRKSVLLIGCVLLVAGLAFAQETGELEKQFAGVSGQAVPKTVLIRTKLAGEKRELSGSGAVISPDGLIITCSHVVPNKEGITVTMPSGAKYEAKLLGQNYVNDYALLKIKAKDLPYFELGDSGKVEEGQPMMALGYPGGGSRDNKPWVAYGKVVALGRNLPVQGFARYYINSIKTNIKSVPGNSGGPLVTREGKLVGINGAIMIFMDRTYAIPVDAIKKSLPELKAGRDVEGTKIKDFAELMKEMQGEFTPEELKKFYEEVKKRITEIEPKEMLENLKKLFGDKVDLDEVMKKFEKLFGGARDELSEAVKKLLGEDGLKELQKELEKLFEDDKALEELKKEAEKAFKELEKLFGGGEKEKEPTQKEEKPAEKKEDVEPPEGDSLDEEIEKMLETLKKRFAEQDKKDKEEPGREDMKKKVEELLEEALGKGKKKPQPPSEGAPYVGVRLSEPEDALKYQLNIDGGLQVDEVREGSPAAKAGLKPGDIIVKVGDKAVGSFEDLAAVLEGRKPGDKIILTVIARGRRVERELELGGR